MVSVVGSEARGDAAASFPDAPSRAAAAWRDLAEGAARSWMWTALALQDIKLRYRGSMLGPFWLTISTVVMIGAMGAIYSSLFHMDVATYLPYLTIGLVIWQFISTVITEGCETFLRAESVIQQIPIPFSIHAYRSVCRNLLVLAHSCVIIPIVLTIVGQPISWRIVEAAAGLALLAINAFWVSVLLGMVSARFRDVPPIVGNFLQVTFFLTPVFWPLDAVGSWKPILALNPLFAAIDVIRAPLLGTSAVASSWPIVSAVTGLGCAITLALFARFRTRIAYWI
ncbi:MAG TPA: ABC transporter permease [Stellaceae bacterium]|nr:ABC transporter permease [Stellaceae bacterium]